MYVTSDHALSATSTEAIAGELKDRTEVTDALFRFALGLDLRDRDLAASAFASDAPLESRAAGQQAGAGQVMNGRDTIVDTVLATIAPLDTTHVVINPRIGKASRTQDLTVCERAAQRNHLQPAPVRRVWGTRRSAGRHGRPVPSTSARQGPHRRDGNANP